MPERDEAGDRAGGYRSDNWDHLKDAGHDREEQDERHLQDRQTDRRDRRHHADEKHLTADISPQERIHMTGERDEPVPLSRWQLSTAPLDEPRPAAQQEDIRDPNHQALKEDAPETDYEGDCRRPD